MRWLMLLALGIVACSRPPEFLATTVSDRIAHGATSALNFLQSVTSTE
jgi:hypothetical protein